MYTVQRHTNIYSHTKMADGGSTLGAKSHSGSRVADAVCPQRFMEQTLALNALLNEMIIIENRNAFLMSNITEDGSEAKVLLGLDVMNKVLFPTWSPSISGRNTSCELAVLHLKFFLSASELIFDIDSANAHIPKYSYSTWLQIIHKLEKEKFFQKELGKTKLARISKSPSPAIETGTNVDSPPSELGKTYEVKNESETEQLCLNRAKNRFCVEDRLERDVSSQKAMTSTDDEKSESTQEEQCDARKFERLKLRAILSSTDDEEQHEIMASTLESNKEDFEAVSKEKERILTCRFKRQKSPNLCREETSGNYTTKEKKRRAKSVTKGRYGVHHLRSEAVSSTDSSSIEAYRDGGRVNKKVEFPVKFDQVSDKVCRRKESKHKLGKSVSCDRDGYLFESDLASTTKRLSTKKACKANMTNEGYSSRSERSDKTEPKMSVHKKCKTQTRKKLNWRDVESSESSSCEISYSSDSSFSELGKRRRCKQEFVQPLHFDPNRESVDL